MSGKRNARVWKKDDSFERFVQKIRIGRLVSGHAFRRPDEIVSSGGFKPLAFLFTNPDRSD